MRLRITFSKSGALRYTGHLDLHSIWERTARRAGLPLAYTQGFHPGPRIQLASALPLGFIGRAEIVDMWINEPGDLSESACKEMLQPAAPPGLIITSVEVVDDHGPALQTQVVSAEYEVTLLEPVDGTGLEDAISTLLATASIPRERRGKMYDLRPLIESLKLSPPGLHMRLSARESATGRPEEVLDALRIPYENTRIERTHLLLK
jgi:radical SAM-linked protein